MTNHFAGTTPRFYAACLASYNNGRLHGAWVDASTDVDAMQEEINAMLRASPCPNVMVEHGGSKVPSAEEYAIHDYDGMPSGLGEYPGLAKIAEYMEFVGKCEAAGLGQVASELWADGIDPDNGAGSGDSELDWVYQYVDDSGLLEGASETLKNYFDYAAFLRDMKLSGDISFVYHGGKYFAFHSA